MQQQLYLPGNAVNVKITARKQLSGRLKLASKNLIFQPSFSKLHDFVGLAARIYSINKLSKREAKKPLERLIREREKSVLFDSSWFEDLDEVKQLPRSFIAELNVQTQSTQKRINFQLFHSQSSSPMIRCHLTDVQYIYKRRYIMKHIALQLIFTKTNHKSLSQRSLYHRRSFSLSNNAHSAFDLNNNNRKNTNNTKNGSNSGNNSTYNTDSEMANDENLNDYINTASK